MIRHQHDAIDAVEGCQACTLLRARMLVYNAVDGLSAAVSTLQSAEENLRKLDHKGLKGYKKDLSPEEVERRRAHGRVLGARVKKALKGDK